MDTNKNMIQFTGTGKLTHKTSTKNVNTGIENTW